MISIKLFLFIIPIFSCLAHVTVNLSQMDIDYVINEDLTVVLNLYERLSLQAYRFAVFLKMSPHWKANQNVNHIEKFVNANSNHLFSLASKWKARKIINFNLNFNEIKWITIYATLNQWKSSNMFHRKAERTFLVNQHNYYSKKIDRFNLNNFKDFINHQCCGVIKNLNRS